MEHHQFRALQPQGRDHGEQEGPCPGRGTGEKEPTLEVLVLACGIFHANFSLNLFDLSDPQHTSAHPSTQAYFVAPWFALVERFPLAPAFPSMLQLCVLLVAYGSARWICKKIK